MNQEMINNFPMTHKPGALNAMNPNNFYKLSYKKSYNANAIIMGEIYFSLWDALEQIPDQETMTDYGNQVYILLLPDNIPIYCWDIRNGQWNKIEDIHV